MKIPKSHIPYDNIKCKSIFCNSEDFTLIKDNKNVTIFKCNQCYKIYNYKLDKITGQRFIWEN